MDTKKETMAIAQEVYANSNQGRIFRSLDKAIDILTAELRERGFARVDMWRAENNLSALINYSLGDPSKRLDWIIFVVEVEG